MKDFNWDPDWIFLGSIIKLKFNKEKHMNYIDKCKLHAKWMKKYDNPENLTLMQIQHEIAKCNGYTNWKDLLDKNKGE